MVEACSFNPLHVSILFLISQSSLQFFNKAIIFLQYPAVATVLFISTKGGGRFSRLFRNELYLEHQLIAVYHFYNHP